MRIVATRLWPYRPLLLGLPLFAFLVSLVVSLMLPKWYTATARVMPPQQSQSNAVAILGQLGGLISAGTSQALGLKNPSDVFVAMLKSRTIADNMIGAFKLQDVYGEQLLHFARRELARNTNIVAGRDGVITIEVEDKNPARAAEMANRYVEELRELTVRLAVSEAGQRRIFFENQVAKTKNDLGKAELELQQYTQNLGLVLPQGQIGLSVAAAAAVRGQISAKEIQLSAMRTFATEDNPDVRRTIQELASLRSELSKMEKATGYGKGDVFVPFGKAPEVGAGYVRRYRDVKYYESLYEALAKQYEIARIDEAKDATLIQVLDPAIAPDYRSRPMRSLIVSLATIAAALVAIVVALFLDRQYATGTLPPLLARARLN